MLTGQCVDGPFSSAVPAGGMEFKVKGQTNCTNADAIEALQTCQNECGDKLCFPEIDNVVFKTIQLVCDGE